MLKLADIHPSLGEAKIVIV